MFQQVNFQGYSLSKTPIPLSIKSDQKITINTLNQYSYCIADKDQIFKKALLESDILIADGVGIVKACSYLTGQSVKKVAGSDMHDYLLQYLNESKKKCFYLGSSHSTLSKIESRLSKEFPQITAGFYSPPYKEEFTEEDLEEMVKYVNDFQPCVVFIGLTAPKQEKLSYFLKNRLNTNIICSIGAVFDFYAQTVTRPSQFWIDLGLEWFVRLVKEPKRMWKRYMYYGFIFIYSILKSKFLNSRMIQTRFGLKKRPQLA